MDKTELLKYTSSTITEVIENKLYLSGILAVTSGKYKTAKITHIINVASSPYALRDNSVIVYNILMEDNDTFNITGAVKAFINLMNELTKDKDDDNDNDNDKKTRILVHCQAGVNRSVVCIVSYLIFLMKQQNINWTCDMCYEYIKKRILNPRILFLRNESFKYQMYKLFEETNLKKTIFNKQ